MKIRIHLKDPDGVGNALDELADEKAAELQGVVPDYDLGDGPREKIYEALCKHIRPWVDCLEYVTIEIDTETQTAIVVKQ